MHSSALGAADLMDLRSSSSAARFSLLRSARYSSMVVGLAGMAPSCPITPSAATSGIGRDGVTAAKRAKLRTVVAVSRLQITHRAVRCIQRSRHVVAKRKILIVDDDIMVANDLEKTLTGLGYEVAGMASSGDGAIAMTAQVEPDLVLIDVSLRGDTSSVVAASELQEQRKIPVVFLIAETDEESLRPAGVTEPYGYVIKPFTQRELRANIDLALCRYDAARAAREMED